MRLYYDRGTVVESLGEEFIIYSPGNHRWIKVNGYMHHLIGLIMLAEGRIDVERIIQSFQVTFGMKIEPGLIENLIDKLIVSGVFFESEMELELASQTELQKVLERRKQTLEEVYVHPTLQCNFNCMYCFNKNVEKNLPELGTGEWIRIVEELEERGVKRIHFTGGEPLLRDDLEEILEATRREGVQFNLLTNGSLLRKRFDTLVPLLDLVVISMDSLDIKVQSKSRSAYGFGDILETIRLFSRHAPEKLKVCAVLTRSNQEKALAFRKEMEERYGIQTIFSWLMPNRLEEVGALPDRKVIEWDRGRRMEFDQVMKPFRCGVCHTVLAIDPQGYVYPCQNFLRDEFMITNILRTSWFEEWNQSEIKKTFGQLLIDKIEKCQDCSYRYFCGGSCPAVAYRVYGEIDHHVEFYCHYLKEMSRTTLRNGMVEWEEVLE